MKIVNSLRDQFSLLNLESEVPNCCNLTPTALQTMAGGQRFFGSDPGVSIDNTRNYERKV